MAHRVTLIPGDGIGPEVIEAARRVLEATGVEFDWDVQSAGAPAMDEEGTPLPPRVVESLRRNRIGLKGPVTTPVGSGFRSVTLALRRDLDLYACLRPAKLYPGARSPYRDVDLVVVRENTEDLYAGIEFAQGSEGALAVRRAVADRNVGRVREDAAIALRPLSAFGTDRIVRFAFDYARANRRRKVTSAHKANIMRETDGLWLEVSREVAKDYPDVEFEDRLVDTLCMQLVQEPERFDVVVLPNLYGDLVSDLCAGLVGGLGVAPGANIGTEGALFEAAHGSAPRYRGMGTANPIALILSGMYLLKHLGETRAALRLEGGVAAVLAEGKTLTYDQKPDRGRPGAATTPEVADAVIAALEDVP
jgi:isocitrate dehydrogenase (NAD+)